MTASIIAIVFLVRGALIPPWYNVAWEAEVVRAIYYATAAVVFVLGILPWARARGA